MIGVFAAADALLFYIFFEATLIPDVHHHRRLGRAEPGLRGVQVLLYHAARFAADAVALVYLYYTAGGSFDLAAWREVKIPLAPQILLFLAFFAASRSRCRCGRCTPGCRMRTSRRPPAAAWCWRRSC